MSSPYRGMRGESDDPMNEEMELAVNHITQMQTPDLLVRHCLALAALDRDRPHARERLEEELGPELTRQLLESLVATER
jgi:hypothetical protein